MTAKPMSQEAIETHKATIDQMNQEDMCRLWRFAPSGHPYFITGTPLTDYFRARFDELGGFIPEISKRIRLG